MSAAILVFAAALTTSLSTSSLQCDEPEQDRCLDAFALHVFAAHDLHYARLREDQELVGVIVEREGQLEAMPMQVVDANRPWQIEFSVNGRFVALLHTHPQTQHPDGFSGRGDEDVGLFKRKGHPEASYVRLASGRVRKLTPDLARASSAMWIPGLAVCEEDAPCLPSLSTLQQKVLAALAGNTEDGSS